MLWDTTYAYKYTPAQGEFSIQSSDFYVLWGREKWSNGGLLTQFGTAAPCHPSLVEDIHQSVSVCHGLGSQPIIFFSSQGRIRGSGTNQGFDTGRNCDSEFRVAGMTDKVYNNPDTKEKLLQKLTESK